MKIHDLKTLLPAVLVVSLGLAWVQSTHLHSKLVIRDAKLLSKSPPVTTQAGELPSFAQKGVDYLASVQFENGGWGAGSHAQQNMIDATQVPVDPATTAFAAMALLRAGHTLEDGKYAPNLQKALDYLLHLIEECPEESASITSIRGTQPQVKLGQNVDATMCVQFLIRVQAHTQSHTALNQRISEAIDTCLDKIQKSQADDGSVSGGGWAPVLQSAMANNALELAYNQGRQVDRKALERSRNYQKQNMDVSGEIKASRGAGVALYSVTSTQRATALEAKRAQEKIELAKKTGKLDKEATISRETLRLLDGISDAEADELAQAYEQNQMTLNKLQDDQVIRGFGNNGGEEFLSFMMTSESLVITGGEAWENWNNKMNQMLSEIQNKDGSWNGHHCITSPVFCTAACILALTAENDRELLIQEKK